MNNDTINNDKQRVEQIVEQLKHLEKDQEIPDEIFQSLTQDELIRVYIEQLIHDKGVEPNDELRADLRKKMENAILGDLVVELPDIYIDQLNNKIDAGAKTEEIDQLLEDSGIDINGITERAMKKFREKELGNEG